MPIDIGKPYNALVTGGAGFIGSNLCERLLREGHCVDVVDDLSNGHKEFLPKGVKFIESDFANKSVLSKIVEDCYDYVFHLAAVPRVSYSVEYPVKTNDTNVSKTLELLEACRKSKSLARLIFASSSSVYGGADILPTPVDCKKDPKSPYALQKSIIEDYLTLYNELYGLDSVALRFFNVFGPNQLGDSPYATAVSAWLDAIYSGKCMRSDGDGSQSRDMCYVDNVTQACSLAAKRREPLNAMRLNVACGERTKNIEILEYLMKKYTDAQKIDAPWRPGDVMHTQADISTTQKELGYEPEVRFWEGLEKTIEWFEENWIDKISKMELNT